MPQVIYGLRVNIYTHIPTSSDVQYNNIILFIVIIDVFFDIVISYNMSFSNVIISPHINLTNLWV